MHIAQTDETEPLLGQVVPSRPRVSSGESNTGVENGEVSGLPLPATNDHQPPRSSVGFRIAAAMYSFLVLGLIASSIGVMIPQLEWFYHLNDTHVSLIFLITPVGYLLAASSNHFIHMKLGQRGIAIVSPLCHLLFTSLVSVHPPFSLVLVSSAIGGFGTGLLDASWCAWAAGMRNANAISGLLHGSFSVGASLGPFLASAMLANAHRPWYTWYYFLVTSSTGMEGIRTDEILH